MSSSSSSAASATSDTFFLESNFPIDVGVLKGYGSDLEDARAGNTADLKHAEHWLQRQLLASSGKIDEREGNMDNVNGLGLMYRRAEWDARMARQLRDKFMSSKHSWMGELRRTFKRELCAEFAKTGRCSDGDLCTWSHGETAEEIDALLKDGTFERIMESRRARFASRESAGRV